MIDIYQFYKSLCYTSLEVAIIGETKYKEILSLLN